MSCVYKDKDGTSCHLLHHTINDNPVLCVGCNQCLELSDGDFAARWIDPLTILDRGRKQTDCFRNMLAGRSAFLIGGGPSANELPLGLLGRRGIWSMAVNNAAGHPYIRPQAMVCSDPPKKFSHSIWLDPGVMKFIPTPKMSKRRGALRRKLPDGSFVPLGMTVTECPNVWGFKRWSWLTPDEGFFLTDGACWGNHETGSKQTGQHKTVCTMLLAIRLLRYLGARKIYLVGIDFIMRPDYGYSFAQGRDAGASASNTNQFAVVNRWLCEMADKKVFAKFGISVYNCFEKSGLRAFEYIPFEAAISEAQGMVETVPDLSYWYDPEVAK